MRNAQSFSVFLVEPDDSVRHAITRVLRSASFAVHPFVSVEALLADHPAAPSACVVADAQDAVDLPSRLRQIGCSLPVLLTTPVESDHLREAARRAGAVGLFRKPVDAHALVDAIVWAVESSTHSPPAATQTSQETP